MNKKLICMLFVLLSLMLTSCLFDDEEEEWSAAKVCPELGTNAKGMPNRGTFTDERDGRVYKYTTIGDQVWMAENLKYELPYPYSMCYGKKACYWKQRWRGDSVGDSICTEDTSKLAEIGQRMNTTCTTNECIADEYCEKYGRYYYMLAGDLLNQEIVDTICPKGWHLPSEKELENLVNEIGSKKGFRLYSQDTSLYLSLYRDLISYANWHQGTDECGFSITSMGKLTTLNTIDRPFSFYLYSRTMSRPGFPSGLVIDLDEMYMAEMQDYKVSVRCLKD